MKKLTCLLFAGLWMLFLHGCASGPESEVAGNVPYHATGKARIYFYRLASASTDAKPVVRLDGANVGTAKPLGFFYADTTPGEHAVKATKEVSWSLKLKLSAGETRYVRLYVTEGKVYPELVDNAVGEKEIAQCKRVK